jgi:myo-inositol-1(or 4)-monophosphatase
MTMNGTIPASREQTPDERRMSWARTVAIEAGGILREMQARRLGLKMISKGGTDFATEADTMAEASIIELIKREFPDDDILAEESAPATYEEYASKENLWVTDPLDGTTNYSLGEENYACSIGFVRRGVPLFAMVNQPARGLLAYGALREMPMKAWIERKTDGGVIERQLQVSPETNPNKCTIGCNFYYTVEGKRRMLAQLDRVAAGGFRAFMARGSAVGDLLAVADGRSHAYIQENLKPWDVAAAGLLVQLAGGMVTGIDGTPWHPFRKDGDILASNGHIHELLLKLLNG